MIVSRRTVLAAASACALLAFHLPARAQNKGLIAIITPSHDNPFFKAEAEGAQKRAE